MSEKKLDILTRALAREKAARKLAESILEKKTAELYKAKQELEKSFSELELLLNKTDSQLQGVFENIVDAYLIMDLNFNIVKMNKSAMLMLGFDQQKVDFNLVNMVLPKDYKRVTKSFQELLKNGSLTNFELEIKTNKNKIIIAHINASIIYQNNVPVAAQGIIRDITTKKETEYANNVINEIAKSILGKEDINEIASKITEQIANYLKTTYCVIYTINHSENYLEQIAASGDKKDKKGGIVNKLKIEIGNGIVGTVAKTGKSELIHDTSKDNRYITDMKWQYSSLTVPIIINNQAIAVINSEHPNKNHFKKAQLDTLKNIAKIIGNKIKNAIDSREHQIAQKKLLQSEERLRILISNLKTGLLFEDENRKIVLTNSKFCDMFEIQAKPEQLVGADCSNAATQSMYLFEKPTEFVERINHILEKKEIVLSDQVIMANGKILDRDFIPLFNQENYLGHLWNYRDVTLEKNFAKSIDVQRQKYSNIIANMNLGLLEVNNKDEILMCNQSFLNMAGYTEKELMGKKAALLFADKKFQKKIKSETQKRLNGYSNSYEINVKNKNQENRTWLISGAPNYNLNGDLIGSIGIHLDITENKKLQLEKDQLVKILKIKNEELSEYAQIVSHDLKSPLRHISAITSWIKEDNQEHLKPTSLEHFAHLDKTLEHMEELISGVLKYSSINTESLTDEPVNLNTVLNTLINTLYIPDHVTLEIKNKLPTLHIDKIKIQQLFQNLLQNAITHNDKEKGLIQIGYYVKNKDHIFYVKDNGIGIEKKYHEKIFKIFNYVTKNKNSTGIGLAIVKKIIDVYGGKIWLESELNKGTTFYFTLNKARL